jgi:hypothetical protein
MKNGTEMHSRNLEGGTGTEHLQVLGSWASEHHLTPRRRGPCHSENAAKFISGTWHQYIRKFEVGVLLGPKPFGLSLLIRSRPRLSPSHLDTTETPRTIRPYSFVQLYLILVLEEARCSLELEPVLISHTLLILQC